MDSYFIYIPAEITMENRQAGAPARHWEAFIISVGGLLTYNYCDNNFSESANSSDMVTDGIAQYLVSNRQPNTWCDITTTKR